MTAPPPFDAVVFDLDGTLVATDRFWIPAARAGARRAFAELGLDHAVPPGGAWMSLVGDPLASGLARLFPDLDPAQRAVLERCCVEEEGALLRSGGAALLPGVAETLAALSATGVRLGVASNCSGAYLRHMLEALELARWIEEPRCLDSPGIGDKADMVEDLLLTFDTRSAVMVGDRAGDRDAAWANGLPHVHYESGFAPHEGTVPAEAAVHDMRELVPRLAARTRWVGEALERLGALRPRPPRAIGVTGGPASGKSLFARDAARLLSASGVHVALVGHADFLPPQDGADRPDGARGVEGAEGVDGPGADLAAASWDLGRLLDLLDTPPPAGELRLVEGPCLLDPRLRTRLDRVVWLDLPEELFLRRAAGREGRGRGPGALARLRERRAAERALEERFPPALADLVLDASNPLGPTP